MIATAPVMAGPEETLSRIQASAALRFAPFRSGDLTTFIENTGWLDGLRPQTWGVYLNVPEAAIEAGMANVDDLLGAGGLDRVKQGLGVRDSPLAVAAINKMAWFSRGGARMDKAGKYPADVSTVRRSNAQQSQPLWMLRLMCEGNDAGVDPLAIAETLGVTKGVVLRAGRSVKSGGAKAAEAGHLPGGLARTGKITTQALADVAGVTKTTLCIWGKEKIIPRPTMVWSGSLSAEMRMTLGGRARKGKGRCGVYDVSVIEAAKFAREYFARNRRSSFQDLRDHMIRSRRPLSPTEPATPVVKPQAVAPKAPGPPKAGWEPIMLQYTDGRSVVLTKRPRGVRWMIGITQAVRVAVDP